MRTEVEVRLPHKNHYKINKATLKSKYPDGFLNAAYYTAASLLSSVHYQERDPLFLY